MLPPGKLNGKAAAASLHNTRGRLEKPEASPWLEGLKLLQEGGELLLRQVPRCRLRLRGTLAILLPAARGGTEGY